MYCINIWTSIYNPIFFKRWDHGGRNSYRMGAEGKFDLKVVSGGATGGEAKQGRKSHSTPSLPDATAVDHQVHFYLFDNDIICFNSNKD